MNKNSESLIKNIEDDIKGTSYSDWFLGDHVENSPLPLVNNHQQELAMFIVLPEDKEKILEYFIGMGKKPDKKYSTTIHYGLYIFSSK